ncbi:hypothetical protein HRI_000243800 [Hibiscus trionum]|uniref:Uncharacterized protein n=1 Tax=Hibiscus trionum TaxID=183268 RepID=A0A9W7GUA4_HIBTR|nr:hypothetical protein HRI_000243800 [Hibiscus trionum]
MEEVIEGMLAEERTGTSIRVFPKLDSLTLDALPRLKRFCCRTNMIVFPLLRHLIIQSCPDLKTFSFDSGNCRTNISLDHHDLFNEKVILPLLEKLEFYKMDNLERLWPDRLAEHSFAKLTSVRLSFCPKLSNVLP